MSLGLKSTAHRSCSMCGPLYCSGAPHLFAGPQEEKGTDGGSRVSGVLGGEGEKGCSCKVSGKKTLLPALHWQRPTQMHIVSKRPPKISLPARVVFIAIMHESCSLALLLPTGRLPGKQRSLQSSLTHTRLVALALACVTKLITAALLFDPYSLSLVAWFCFVSISALRPARTDTVCLHGWGSKPDDLCSLPSDETWLHLPPPPGSA